MIPSLTTKTQLLLVEDDASMGFLLKDSLEMAGYEVKLCQDGNEGLRTFFNGHFHLCLLDVMLPKRDGFDLAKNIRNKDTATPIIFLTAKEMKEDKIQGFQIGADDYITKPFSVEELVLRIEAVLKRTRLDGTLLSPPPIIQLGKCELDANNQQLTIQEENKSLTYREAKLLKLFFMHPNQILERDFILQIVWEEEGLQISRSLDVFVSRLRKILQTDENLQISNVHGVGYKLMVAT